MKQLFILSLFILGAICARAQFADTTAVNQYINDNIKDKRPDKVTADQLRQSLLGVSSMIGKYCGTNPTPVNIYNSDGSLTGNRRIDLAGNRFQISGSQGSNQFNMEAWGSNFRLTGTYVYGNESRFSAISDFNMGYGQSYLSGSGFNYGGQLNIDTTSSSLYNYQYLGDHAGNTVYTEKNLKLDTSGVLYTKHTAGTFEISLDTLFRIDTSGNTWLSKYKNNVAGDSVLSTDVNGHLLLRAINQNYIENRVAPAQSAANFNIDGTARAHAVKTANLLVTDNSAIFGGVSYKIQTFTGNTTLDYTNYSVLVNNSGTVTMTLPPAVDNPGAVYFIKKISPASNNVIVDGEGNDTVDGGGNKTLTLQNSCIMVQSDGVTNWVVLASHVGNATM